VEKGTVRRGITHPEIQSRLSDLGNFIGGVMHAKGYDCFSLALRSGVTLDDSVAIRYGVGTLRETRENLPRVGIALDISSEQIDPSVLKVLWPDNARGWLIP